MQARPRIVAIIGESGGGKSTVAQQLVGSDPRVIIVAPYMKNPYGAIAFTDYAAAKVAMVAHRPKTFRIAIACYTVEEFAKICRLAWAVAPVTLVVDETAVFMPNAAAAPDEFRFICQIGRHAGHDENQEVRLIVLGQRPANLPPFCRAEAKEVYLFPLASERDVERVAEDFSLPRETRAFVMDKLPSLPKYHRLRMTKQDSGTWTTHYGTGT